MTDPTKQVTSLGALNNGQVLVVHNRMAGADDRRQRVDALFDQLRHRGLKPIAVDRLDDLERMTVDGMTAGNLQAVVAAGGDGTAEAVVNRTPAGTPLAVFPLGTENLLAKYLGISADPTETAGLIEAGNVTRLDVGQVTSADGEARIFLLVMGCGFDADVIHRLHASRQGHITHMSYAKPIFESIRRYDYPRLRVSCFDLARPERENLAGQRMIVAHWAFVFNTPSYAIGLAICPDADPRDGFLNIATFRGGSFWKGMVHLSNVLLGRQRHSRRVEMLRAKRIRIESNARVPFQIDGEPGGMLPVEVSVIPGRLAVLVPGSPLGDRIVHKGGAR